MKRVKEQDLKVGDLLVVNGDKVFITKINRETPYPYRFSNEATGEQYGGNWKLSDEDFYLMEQKQGDSMLSGVKEYFQKNRDVVFTLILCILVDKFVFNGAFTAKIKNTIDKLLDDTHKRITK